MGSARGTWTLARALGVVAGLLAWVAALISYFRNGEIELGLIAAGIFIAALPFAASTRPKKPPDSGGS